MMKWYVIHTFASQEDHIKEVIEKGVKGTPLEEKVGQILIPKQKTYQSRAGKKVERERKVFFSYVILELDLTNELINYIRNIPGVTNFLGTAKKPIPLPQDEVDRLLGISSREKADSKTCEFLPGDIVRINSGPFTDFQGVVRKSSPDGTKLTVEVTVFGRTTPVEVNAEQVEIHRKTPQS